MRRRFSETSHADPRRNQKGLALVVVLWSAVILALLAAGVARVSREETALTRSLRDVTQAELAADAGVARVIHELGATPNGRSFSRSGVREWSFDGAEIRAVVANENNRIDINRADEALLAALLQAASAPNPDKLASAIMEVRDTATSGASGDEAPPPVFTLTDDLLKLDGFDRQVFSAIADSITVYTAAVVPDESGATSLVKEALTIWRKASAAEAAAQSGASTEEAGDGASEDQAALGADPIYRIHVEARLQRGAVFVRQAIVAFGDGGIEARRVLLWSRGERRLFPF